MANFIEVIDGTQVNTDHVSKIQISGPEDGRQVVITLSSGKDLPAIQIDSMTKQGRRLVGIRDADKEVTADDFPRAQL
jgi:hypothetical protein